MSGNTPHPGTPPDTTGDAPEPKVGDKIGSYKLMRLIGEGAAGRVFEVEHLKIGRRAAMKILAPQHAARPGAIKRLFTEARAVNQINHPHIVEMTDLVEAEREGEVNAIVMELLEGQSLGEAMQPAAAMPPERFLPILAQVASALAAAHAAHFVHRDLKPENIFLTSRGNVLDYVKLLDFGLAKSIAGDVAIKPPVGAVARTAAAPPPMAASHGTGRYGRTIIHATAEGTFVGTPAYASPEQAAGKPLDHRTDLYSLGVILYELLCGRLPFEGKNFGEYLVKHITAPLPPPPPEVVKTEFGRRIHAIAVRCLAKNPADRWSSADDLKDTFDALAHRASSETSVVQAPGAGPRGGRKWLLVGAAGFALLLAGGTLLLFGRGGERPTPARLNVTAPLETEGPSGRPTIEPLFPDKTVVVTFRSDPPGAETRRVGRDELLGLTPFHHTFEADGSTVQFEMLLPGHAPLSATAVLSSDTTVGGKLLRLAPPPEAKKPARPPPPPARPKVTRGTTLNPFAR